ncbi:hypothetical protein EU94_1192 [Prochlorococcus marinus str. MIT 9123]|nr:hypothetical protein EU94_1192 [Prochlorococcus marinus str. MIT 9123]
MVAVWVSFWVYSNINGFHPIFNRIDQTYGNIFGIFLAGVFVVFPTYKLTKKYIWKK